MHELERRRPLRRVLVHAPRDEVGDLLRRLLGDLDLPEGPSGRRLPGRQLPEQHAERVDVGRLGRGFAEEDLGRGPGKGADGLHGREEAVAQDLGEADVGHFGVFFFFGF